MRNALSVFAPIPHTAGAGTRHCALRSKVVVHRWQSLSAAHLEASKLLSSSFVPCMSKRVHNSPKGSSSPSDL